MRKFIIARKVKSKWYGIAYCESDCLNGASKIFYKKNGFSDYRLHIDRIESFENQKNYGGRLPEFKAVN